MSNILFYSWYCMNFSGLVIAMSMVILIFCPLEIKSTLSSFSGGPVLMHELHVILALSTQSLASSQSFNLSRLSLWLPDPISPRKLLMIGPVASKVRSLTNAQNFSSSWFKLWSFLQEWSSSFLSSCFFRDCFYFIGIICSICFMISRSLIGFKFLFRYSQSDVDIS